jgi:hypothetical protein
MELMLMYMLFASIAKNQLRAARAVTWTADIIGATTEGTMA